MIEINEGIFRKSSQAIEERNFYIKGVKTGDNHYYITTAVQLTELSKYLNLDSTEIVVRANKGVTAKHLRNYYYELTNDI